ncbi:Eukaryotic initiation factor 4A-II [Ranunculus cassubicifolius]
MEKSYESFGDMNLKHDLLKGIYAYGLGYPSTIQQIGIIPLCDGYDVVLQAASHPAKTLTYCIGILQRIDHTLPNCQCLVLLTGPGYAREVKADLEALGCYLGVKVRNCHAKEDALSTGFHIAVGHCYEVSKLLRSGKVCSTNIKMVILDEAELLLTLDSRVKEVNDMFGLLSLKINKGLQVGFFSQTMPVEILENISKMVNDPMKFVARDPEEVLTLDSIKKHEFIYVEKEESKMEKLVTLLKQGSNLTIVFVDNPTKVPTLVKELMKFGLKVSETRTGMNNKARVEVMEDFLKSRVLVTTWMWSRGMVDLFDRVPLIVNYDTCLTPREYIARIGLFRGVATSICFATSDDWSHWISIQAKCNIKIESPSLFNADMKSIKAINIINEEKDCRHFVYNIENEEEKVDELVSSLCGDLIVARTSVIFVSSPERVSELVSRMSKISECTLHFTSDIVDMEKTMGPCVLVTTDEEVNIKVKVKLVMNYDPPSTVKHYYRRLCWCQNNGVVVHLATDENFLKLLDMQISCSVFLRPLPARAIDVFGPSHDPLPAAPKEGA